MRTVVISCLVLMSGGLAQCSWNQEPLRLAQVRQCFDDGGAYNETRAQQEVNIVRHAMDHYSYLDLVRNSGPPWDYRLDTTAVLQNLSATASVPGAYAQDWSFYVSQAHPVPSESAYVPVHAYTCGEVNCCTAWKGVRSAQHRANSATPNSPPQPCHPQVRSPCPPHFH